MTISTTTQASTTRRAFTLLELLLVMAVVVIVLGLGSRSVGRAFQQTALTSGADRLRAAMGEARVLAIRDGDVYAVFVSLGNNWFDVAPYANSQTVISRAIDDQRYVDDQGNSGIEENLLPNGVRFAASEVLADGRAASILSGTESSSGGGLQQILFYPDGTSQDASVILQNDLGGIVEVQLRGLTGLSKSVRLKELR